MNSIFLANSAGKVRAAKKAFKSTSKLEKEKLYKNMQNVLEGLSRNGRTAAYVKQLNRFLEIIDSFFTIKPSPGKGLGLFAAKKINATHSGKFLTNFQKGQPSVDKILDIQMKTNPTDVLALATFANEYSHDSKQNEIFANAKLIRKGSGFALRLHKKGMDVGKKTFNYVKKGEEILTVYGNEYEVHRKTFAEKDTIDLTREIIDLTQSVF